VKRSLSRKGMSPTKAEEEAEKKVLSMLPQDESRIRWSELEKKARSQGMSLRTLSKHLDELTNAKLVARDVDSEARPPRVYFQLRTSGIFRGMFELMPPEAVDTKSLSAKIAKIKNPELKQQALRALLETQISLLVLEMLRTWEFGVMFSENERTQSFYRIMIASYIAPMIADLGSLCKAHGDIAPGTLTSLFGRYAEDCRRAGAELSRIDSTFFETRKKRTTS
jgi:DNA-binding transcriptional ArsR family regulator